MGLKNKTLIYKFLRMESGFHSEAAKLGLCYSTCKERLGIIYRIGRYFFRLIEERGGILQKVETLLLDLFQIVLH